MKPYIKKLRDGRKRISMTPPIDGSEPDEIVESDSILGVSNSMPVFFPPEEKHITVEQGQIQAISERQEFLEDCIAEMAQSIYN